MLERVFQLETLVGATKEDSQSARHPAQPIVGIAPPHLSHYPRLRMLTLFKLGYFGSLITMKLEHLQYNHYL